MGDLTQDIQNALSYIKTRLTEELEIREIAKRAYVSPFYSSGFCSTLWCGCRGVYP